jgi:hypothetical protein
MTTTIVLAAIVGAILGFIFKCVVNVVDEWIEERNIRKAIEWYGLDPEAQPSTSEAVPAPDPQPVELIRTKRCPEGWSAKQVLGRGDVRKRWIEPQFPGGLEAWDRMHDAREVA